MPSPARFVNAESETAYHRHDFRGSRKLYFLSVFLLKCIQSQGNNVYNNFPCTRHLHQIRIAPSSQMTYYKSSLMWLILTGQRDASKENENQFKPRSIFYKTRRALIAFHAECVQLHFFLLLSVSSFSNGDSGINLG